MLNRGRYLRFAIMLPDGSWMRAAVNVEERLPELIAHIQKMHASASAWKQCRDEKLSKVFFDECTEILRVVLGAGELKRAAALCGGAIKLCIRVNPWLRSRLLPAVCAASCVLMRRKKRLMREVLR